MQEHSLIQMGDHRKIVISTAYSMTSKKWKAEEISWHDFMEKVREPHRTTETLAEFNRMAKPEQLRLKDAIGGYVGGPVIGGQRLKDSIKERQLICLDADFAGAGFVDDLECLFEHSAVVHTTRKHSKDAPKYRVLIPTSRVMNFEEYQAVIRRIAQRLGMSYFDHTCFQFERLMFWPTVSADTEDYEFHQLEGPWLDVDEVLATYNKWGTNYEDISLWPLHDGERSVLEKSIRKAGDPTEKPGIIGAFCRAFTLEDAIDSFLEDVYEPAGEGRWTFTGGSSAGGAWAIGDTGYLKSFHGTDPVAYADRPWCAWDVVRIHLFGDLDDDPLANPSGLESHAKMVALAMGLPEVKRGLIDDEFLEPVVDAGANELAVTEKVELSDVIVWNDSGTKLQPIIRNVVSILKYHPHFDGALQFNEFTGRMEVTKKLPWRKAGGMWEDSDTAHLRQFLEHHPFYIRKRDIVNDAIDIASSENSYHPVRDYLNGLEWDGVKRLDSVLINFFGAEDSEYVRLATRRFFVGAVARIYSPGCKWDYTLTLVGAQGTGKSTFVRKISRGWFTDNLVDLNGKDAKEALQGKWIIELGEMSATRRSDVEHTKAFLTTQVDMYRPPYGRREIERPRQCVFLGTTNEPEFLKDATGNRRFWPVKVDASKRTVNVWDDMSDELVSLLWAEAKAEYESGESLYLNEREEQLATEARKHHEEVSDVAGVIEAWLNKPIPLDWDAWDSDRQMMFDPDIYDGQYRQRNHTCPIEIWYECLKERNQPKHLDSKKIKEILRKLDGWIEPDGTHTFKAYGRQRYFLRDENAWML